jgi:hypothetical protein
MEKPCLHKQLVSDEEPQVPKTSTKYRRKAIWMGRREGWSQNGLLLNDLYRCWEHLIPKVTGQFHGERLFWASNKRNGMERLVLLSSQTISPERNAYEVQL